MLKFIQVLSFLVFKVTLVNSKSDNKPPYFLNGGDFSSFSIPENFQIGTSVYKLKGIFYAQNLAHKTHRWPHKKKNNVTKKSHIHYGDFNSEAIIHKKKR